MTPKPILTQRAIGFLTFSESKEKENLAKMQYLQQYATFIT